MTAIYQSQSADQAQQRKEETHLHESSLHCCVRPTIVVCKKISQLNNAVTLYNRHTAEYISENSQNYATSYTGPGN